MAELNYGRMMQRAMQGLMAEALSIVAEHGLPDDHHFYISFATQHPGVDIPDWLAEQYPRELTIVLQHQYADLAVTEDRFSVKVFFQSRPARLVVPFDSVRQFADPSAEFGLRFDPTDEDDEDEDEEAEAVEESGDAAPNGDSADEARPAGEVVNLDAFRKK